MHRWKKNLKRFYLHSDEQNPIDNVTISNFVIQVYFIQNIVAN